MSWRLAASLIQLRKQVNEQFTERDKSSDGSIGDTAHSMRKSDHNPNTKGVVTAIDVDRDFNDGHDGRELVSALSASKDARVKYIIFEKQITVPGDITKWKPYHGANAHNHHIHISASADPKEYDDPKPWLLNWKAAENAKNAPATPMPRLFKRGTKGEGVKVLQAELISRGWLRGKADGSFGPKTEEAVRRFQSANRLQPDGIAGTITLLALGL